MEELYETDPLMIDESIEEWVMSKCENWRDYYESNYEGKFEEYSGVVSGTLLILSVGLSVPALFLLHFNRQLSLM